MSESSSQPPSSASGGPPTMVGRYQILRKLGQGGMGAVYEAEHSKLQKRVALKVLPREVASDPAAIARFEREMLAVGRITHPGIVQAHDADEADGIRYLAMELVDGYDVADAAAYHEGTTNSPMPLPVACEIIRQASVAIQAAHEAGLVHRDLKPSNLMLSVDGNVKVLDLGLAMLDSKHGDGSNGLTATGQVMGTIDYMAPEQARETRSVDARADVYSLGATLYRLIAGRPPYAGDRYSSVLQKLMALANADPTPIEELRPDCPSQLIAVVVSAMAKDPSGRIATAAELAAALGPISDQAKLVQFAAKMPTRKAPDRCDSVATCAGGGESESIGDLSGIMQPGVTVQATGDTNKTPEVTIDALPLLAVSRSVGLDNVDKSSNQQRPSQKATVPRWAWGIGLAVCGLLLSIPLLSNSSPRPTVKPTPVKPTTVTQPSSSASNGVVAGPDVAEESFTAPALAVAPFSKTAAKRHQREWASFLGTPIERRIGLPGGQSLTLTLIPPGEYTRGSGDKEREKFIGWGLPAGLKDLNNEKPAHRVRLTEPFYLSTFEVTHGQFQSFKDATAFDPDAGTAPAETGNDHPVVDVSWNDAAAFCEWSSAESGLEIRLPTDAQWEYACRAGTTTSFYFGENANQFEDYGRYFSDAKGVMLPRRPDPVGGRLPNAFGLYDMHGNAMEWCADWYNHGYQSDELAINPTGPTTGKTRVRRGGGWSFGREGCRSASRLPGGLGYRNDTVGFRVAIPINLQTR